MNINKLILFAFALGTGACGAAAGGGASTVKAPVITGTSKAGVIIAATNVDSSVKSTFVYYYDFAQGSIKTLLSSATGNPAVFYADGKGFLFDRDSGQKDLRIFDPRSASTVSPEPLTLPDLAAGDPWDVTSLVPGQSLLLASPAAGKLQALDYTTGVVSDAAKDSDFASGTVRAHAFLRDGSRVDILHSGITPQLEVDNTQQVYSATIATNGDLTFSGVAADGKVQGAALQMSNPSGFLNVTASSATIVGLCTSTFAGCDAGVDTYSRTDRSASHGSSLASLGYSFKNQIVSGANGSVFAQAEGGSQSQSNALIKLDPQTGKASVLVSLPDNRLYGIAFDDDSKTLFAGGTESLKGTLTLYRNDTTLGTVDLDGVPYQFAFVED